MPVPDRIGAPATGSSGAANSVAAKPPRPRDTDRLSWSISHPSSPSSAGGASATNGPSVRILARYARGPEGTGRPAVGHSAVCSRAGNRGSRRVVTNPSYGPMSVHTRQRHHRPMGDRHMALLTTALVVGVWLQSPFVPLAAAVVAVAARRPGMVPSLVLAVLVGM